MLAEDIREDIDLQLQNLIYPGYLQQSGLHRLRHLPRYLKGILVRLQKYDTNPQRDLHAAKELSPFMKEYVIAAEQWQNLTPLQQEKLESCHWLLEEFRISLFAQELGTDIPVSAKRIKKLFTEYRQT